MEHVTEKKIENYLIRTFYDESPESPREWSNLGTMVCYHPRYSFGDKNNYRSGSEVIDDLPNKKEIGVILPLYIHDHSGITMNTTGFSCQWDTSKVGFIYITKEKIREEYGIKRITKEWVEKITEYLKGEVETYDQYLRGDIYGYRIYKVTKCELGHEHEEELDSCWGYYGEESCLEEAESLVKYYIDNEVVPDTELSDMLHSVDRN